MSQQDLEFISGRFFHHEIPKEKQYLCKYFRSELQQAFLRYYMCFGSVRMFREHTGYHCNKRLLFRFKKRFHILVDAYDQAKSSLTEENMAIVFEIESGNYRCL